MLSQYGCPIAPSTYYDNVSRRPSRRALRDAEIVVLMVQQRAEQKLVQRFGARKMWLHLRSKGHDVARCTIERLMAEQGWTGATRAKTVRTKVPQPGAARAPNLVERDFTATAPNQLWVADLKCRRRHLMSSLERCRGVLDVPLAGRMRRRGHVL